jgi:hypothetical protein
MTAQEFIRIQLRNHGVPHEFDMAVQRVLPVEIAAARFFSPGGDPIAVVDRHDLLALCRAGREVMMVHRLFSKETVYRLFISKDMEVE